MQNSKLKSKIKNFSPPSLLTFNFKLLTLNSSRRRAGFTLIELLVVMFVILTVGAVVSAILVSSLRGTSKTNTIDIVRRNGNSAISQMGKMIQYAQNFDGVSTDGVNYTADCSYPLSYSPIIIRKKESFFSKIAEFIQEFVSLGKEKTSSLFSKLEDLIPKFEKSPIKEAVAAASPTLDAKSYTAGSYAKSLSWNHTVGSNSNRLLLVSVSFYGSSTSITSITYGTASLTRIGGIKDINQDQSEMWYLINPTSGTATIKVNFSTYVYPVGGATSWSGVDQTAPLSNYTTASGYSKNPSVNVVSKTGAVVEDNLAAYSSSSPTVGSGQTQLWNTVASSVELGASSTKPGADSVTMSWTFSLSRYWAIGGVSINPAAPTPTPTATFTPGPTPSPTPAPSPTPTPPLIQYNYVKITSFDRGTTIFSCLDSSQRSPNGQIASNGANLVDTNNSVSVDSCFFTCSQDNIVSPPIIGINFTLSSKTSSNFFEKKASIPFQTSVTMRNF